MQQCPAALANVPSLPTWVCGESKWCCISRRLSACVHRFEREYGKGHRSVLKKVLEQDERASRAIILCVAEVLRPEPGAAQQGELGSCNALQQAEPSFPLTIVVKLPSMTHNHWELRNHSEMLAIAAENTNREHNSISADRRTALQGPRSRCSWR